MWLIASLILIISGLTAILVLISEHAAGICFIIIILCTILSLIPKCANALMPVVVTAPLSILAYLWLKGIVLYFEEFTDVEEGDLLSISNINDAIEFYGGFACLQILLFGLWFVLDERDLKRHFMKLNEEEGYMERNEEGEFEGLGKLFG